MNLTKSQQTFLVNSYSKILCFVTLALLLQQLNSAAALNSFVFSWRAVDFFLYSSVMVVRKVFEYVDFGSKILNQRSQLERDNKDF